MTIKRRIVSWLIINYRKYQKRHLHFSIPNHNGKKVSLADFKGKWLVFYFYPKDNTSGCTKEAIEFTAAKDKFTAENAVIVGVSPDSEKSHCNFIAKHSLGIELLSDTEKEVVNSYGVWQLKKMAGREYYGVVRSTFLIDPAGNLAEVWTKVRGEGSCRKSSEPAPRATKLMSLLLAVHNSF